MKSDIKAPVKTVLDAPQCPLAASAKRTASLGKLNIRVMSNCSENPPNPAFLKGARGDFMTSDVPPEHERLWVLFLETYRSLGMKGLREG
jgi:hypothetical protein